ncbi:hypothetical protein EJ02DRAFT_48934 [Clathrospora elynae]|uniref:Uncharacterized protein n=1 Tax=Clathrospora elynae TaxID=706981 RepID=A0A6A5SGR5_9PLEO|nr:hypothetical protein EJ02DRAFT_48934 [Clathrospora elynae]
MMAAFTCAPAPPEKIPPANATLPASDQDTTADYTATTPPFSPKRQSSSATPEFSSNSTPLHCRFLQEVDMSPATPPRTPSPAKRSDSPTKGSDSPTRGPQSPVKRSAPPIKQQLEVGANGFYFSCELPMSKVTPKKEDTPSKTATPKKDSEAGAESRTRTPSPLKKTSPMRGGGQSEQSKQSPAKMLFGAPKKDGGISSPTRVTSPLKNKSPAKGSGQSPAKALLGSPKRDAGIRTPASRRPSLLKNASPVKQSLVMARFGTPTRGKVGTPANSRPGSPVKLAIEQDSPKESVKKVSKLAEVLSSRPTAALHIPPGCLTDVTGEKVLDANPDAPIITRSAQNGPAIEKARPAAKSQPSDIGHLMAGLNTENVSTHDWANAQHAGEKVASPAPTPLRRASEKLRLDGSPSFLRLSTNSAPGVTNGPLERHTGSSAPPEPGTKEHRTISIHNSDAAISNAAESLSRRTTETRQERKDDAAHLFGDDLPTRRPSKASPEPSALGMIRKEQAVQHRPLLIPMLEPEVIESPKHFEKQLKWQETGTPKMKPIDRRTVSQQRRIGTDPSVLLAMRKEMVSVESSMRRSSGIDPSFCGPLNMGELPAMSDNFFVRDQWDVRSPGVVGTPTSSRTHSRTNSDIPSIGTVRASMEMSAQHRAGLTDVSITPSWSPKGQIPSHSWREKILDAKEVDAEHRGTEIITTPGTPFSRAMSAVSVKPVKSATAPAVTLRKRATAPRATTMPSRSNVHNSPARQAPSAVPAKTKIGATAVPRTARKSIVSSAPKPTAAPASKPPFLRPRPSHIQKLALPVKPKPADPSTDPRPYEQKFVSAVAIADRVAEWNSEDRKKAKSPHLVKTANNPTKAPTKMKSFLRKPSKIGLKVELKESFTPEGSPTKPLSPIKDSDLPPSIKGPAYPPPYFEGTTTPKHSPSPKPGIPSPRIRAPKTPGPRNPAVTRLKQAAALKTPVSHLIPILDRNALRTPSKTIVSSLDKAIDAKIAEDARSGKEFTPSGNRVSDLLDARVKGVGV